MFNKTIMTAMLLMASLSGNAMAQDHSFSGNRNYVWLINSLKMDGISPSRIQWSEIDGLCLPTYNSPEYNLCRLEKARLQYDHGEDSENCQASADAFRPNMLRYKAVVMDGSDPHGYSNATLSMLNSTPAVTNEPAFREHLYNQCMRGLGWKNPRDYRRGRQA